MLRPQRHLNHFNFIWDLLSQLNVLFERLMLCSCCGLKIVLPLSIEGYQATATANGLYIAMVTLINKGVGAVRVP